MILFLDSRIRCWNSQKKHAPDNHVHSSICLVFPVGLRRGWFSSGMMKTRLGSEKFIIWLFYLKSSMNKIRQSGMYNLMGIYYSLCFCRWRSKERKSNPGKFSQLGARCHAMVTCEFVYQFRSLDILHFTRWACMWNRWRFSAKCTKNNTRQYLLKEANQLHHFYYSISYQYLRQEIEPRTSWARSSWVPKGEWASSISYLFTYFFALILCFFLRWPTTVKVRGNSSRRKEIVHGKKKIAHGKGKSSRQKEKAHGEKK